MRWLVALLFAAVLVPVVETHALVRCWTPPRFAMTSEQKLSADLDGDGRRDSIHVRFFREWHASGAEDDCVVVRVGSCEICLTGEGTVPEVGIVDLDSADVRCELQFAEEGPSDDPMATFVAMNGDSLVVLGEIPGEPSLLGNGLLRSEARGRVLHTWWYTQHYVLQTPTRLVPVEQALHPMRTRVTLRDSLTLIHSPTDSRVVFKLRAGDRAELLSTDNKRWVLLRDARGRVGWFELEGDGLIAEGHREGQSVFEGLSIVD